MKSTIRRILKEELSTKDKLLNMIDQKGLVYTAKRVNGVETLSKVVDIPIHTLIMNEIGNKTFSTDDLERRGITTGGYDFKFQINSIVLKKPIAPIYGLECDIYFTIKEGTVTLIMTNDETYDLLDPRINDKHWKWEVDNEIRDLIYEFVNMYLDNLNLYISDYDIWFDNH
jgi:hypothetical protein